ncbi:MAG: hypothetical protein SOW44_08735 [Porphyromonas sp.]|nr:hypothetical protein [Bacteroidales bacterium]MDY3101405.1 hypothetical protein [Porphyromonas sp.]
MGNEAGTSGTNDGTSAVDPMESGRPVDAPGAGSGSEAAEGTDDSGNPGGDAETTTPGESGGADASETSGGTIQEARIGTIRLVQDGTGRVASVDVTQEVASTQYTPTLYVSDELKLRYPENATIAMPTRKNDEDPAPKTLKVTSTYRTVEDETERPATWEIVSELGGSPYDIVRDARSLTISYHRGVIGTPVGAVTVTLRQETTGKMYSFRIVGSK